MKYPDFITIKNIVIDNDKINNTAFRYSLKIPIDHAGSDSILVIMMNPAEANAEKSDATINRLLNYIHHSHNSYGEVTVANLYPLYEPSSQKLKLNNTECELNINKIDKLIANVDNIILGWGKPNNMNQKKLHSIQYHHQALRIVNLLINSNTDANMVNGLRENLYPKHLGRIGYNDKMIKCDLTHLKQNLLNQIERNENKYDKRT